MKKPTSQGPSVCPHRQGSDLTGRCGRLPYTPARPVLAAGWRSQELVLSDPAFFDRICYRLPGPTQSVASIPVKVFGTQVRLCCFFYQAARKSFCFSQNCDVVSRFDAVFCDSGLIWLTRTCASLVFFTSALSGSARLSNIEFAAFAGNTAYAGDRQT